MRVKYKKENFSLCRNYSDSSLAMGFPTSSGFIKLIKTPNNKLIKLTYKTTFSQNIHNNAKIYLYKSNLSHNNKRQIDIRNNSEIHGLVNTLK